MADHVPPEAMRLRSLDDGASSQITLAYWQHLLDLWMLTGSGGR